MKHLHVIAFDIPYPANYGGVIDVFYKLKALKSQNIKIILHCFEYGRRPDKILNEICEKVYYYPRKQSIIDFFSLTPFIVKSRASKKLLENLLLDHHPILFEGLHSCLLLDHKLIQNRIKTVRMHNIEHHYYLNLGKTENNWFKKFYFFSEALKLKLFEKKLKFSNTIAAISLKDLHYLLNKFNQTELISAFHGHSKIDILPGKGNYALYHGNLSVNENNQAALFLVNEVFHLTSLPLIIAGNSPSKALTKACQKKTNITLMPDVKQEELENLIRNAHLNILPTFQSTGIKLKLLHALYKGRFCLVNQKMVEQTGLEKYCIVGYNPTDFIENIKRFQDQEFTEKNIAERQALLKGNFADSDNAKKLVELIFKD